MSTKENPTYVIDIQPLGDGRLQVSVPEIGASTIVESTKRDAAMDAAYKLIDAYLRKQRETAKAS